VGPGHPLSPFSSLVHSLPHLLLLFSFFLYQNDLFCVWWDVKLNSINDLHIHTCFHCGCIVGERLGSGSCAESPGIVPPSSQSGRVLSNDSSFQLNKSSTSTSGGMRW